MKTHWPWHKRQGSYEEIFDGGRSFLLLVIFRIYKDYVVPKMICGFISRIIVSSAYFRMDSLFWMMKLKTKNTDDYWRKKRDSNSKVILLKLLQLQRQSVVLITFYNQTGRSAGIIGKPSDSDIKACSKITQPSLYLKRNRIFRSQQGNILRKPTFEYLLWRIRTSIPTYWYSSYNSHLGPYDDQWAWLDPGHYYTLDWRPFWTNRLYLKLIEMKSSKTDQKTFKIQMENYL